jgi:predicted  nucleic acid-binding Zn-ribbon protein
MRHQQMDLEDLTLLVRALHRDVSELDERLRRVEETMAGLRYSDEETAIELDTPIRT